MIHCYGHQCRAMVTIIYTTMMITAILQMFVYLGKLMNLKDKV